MLTPGQIALARSLDESAMTDAVEITKHSDESPALDESTGEYPESRAVVYQGAARMSARVGREQSRNELGDQTTVTTLTLSLPVEGSSAVDVGHRVRVTASPNDEGIVGHEYRVVSIPSTSNSAARRFQVELYR